MQTTITIKGIMLIEDIITQLSLTDNVAYQNPKPNTKAKKVPIV